MKDWKVVRKELLKDKRVAQEYKKLTPRYTLVSQLIKARVEKGLTQKQLARRVGTRQSAIARVESGRSNLSIGFLEKLTNALGSRLIIQVK